MKKIIPAVLLLLTAALLLSGCAVTDAVPFIIGTEDTAVIDPLFCPYYGMLSASSQKVYRQLYAAVSEYKTSVTPAAFISVDEAETVVTALMHDHPEFFWIASDYSVSYFREGLVLQIDLSSSMPAEEIPEARRRFDTAAEQLIGEAGLLTSFYDREKYVHDRILNGAEYDASDIAASQSAYSALVTGRTVCAGYSRAFQYIMTRLSIPTYYCTGYSSGEHAWNIIRLDDGFYNIDVTWDATDPVSYGYFNRTDSEFESTHTRTGLSVYLPRCEAYGFRGPEETSYVLPSFAPVEIPHGIDGADTSSYGTVPPVILPEPEPVYTPEPMPVFTPEPAYAPETFMTPAPESGAVSDPTSGQYTAPDPWPADYLTPEPAVIAEPETARPSDEGAFITEDILLPQQDPMPAYAPAEETVFTGAGEIPAAEHDPIILPEIFSDEEQPY